MNRRSFLKALAATAAGVLVPGQALAEPERRIWALDQTMTQPAWPGWLIDPYIGDVIRIDDELIWIGPDFRLYRGIAGSIQTFHEEPWAIELIGFAQPERSTW